MDPRSDSVQSPWLFALKVLGLSIFLSGGLFVLCLIAGLFLYIALDPLMQADDLAAFTLFFFPTLLVGVPAVVASARLTLLRRRPLLIAGLLGVSFVFGTLGFAGFMVAAMGI